jgi:chemotaxis family two-component system response regulator Rcp1
VTGGANLMRILLVEDSLADVELTLDALKDAKVANDVASPDLVILDLNLPRLSGQEVLAVMKADESLRRIPVAVLTTSSAESDVAKTYDLGANCFLTKPVDIDQFIHVVQSIDDFWLGLVRLPK